MYASPTHVPARRLRFLVGAGRLDVLGDFAAPALALRAPDADPVLLAHGHLTPQFPVVLELFGARQALRPHAGRFHHESYEKPGQYGDAQQTIQRFTDLEGAHAATVSKLNKGDKVRLEWDHNYVTRTENGGESKYPERVITALEPIA